MDLFDTNVQMKMLLFCGPTGAHLVHFLYFSVGLVVQSPSLSHLSVGQIEKFDVIGSLSLPFHLLFNKGRKRFAAIFPCLTPHHVWHVLSSAEWYLRSVMWWGKQWLTTDYLDFSHSATVTAGAVKFSHKSIVFPSKFDNSIKKYKYFNRTSTENSMLLLQCYRTLLFLAYHLSVVVWPG